MIDTRLDGTPIVRSTLCKVGTHAFTWMSEVNTISLMGNSQQTYTGVAYFDVRCDCGAYAYGEWLDVMGLCHYCGKAKHDEPTAICGYRKKAEKP